MALEKQILDPLPFSCNMAGLPTWSMKVAGMLLVWGVHTSANAGSCVGAKPEVEGSTHGLAMMQRDAELQKAVIAEETIGTGADSPDIVEVNGLFIMHACMHMLTCMQRCIRVWRPCVYAYARFFAGMDACVRAACVLHACCMRVCMHQRMRA